MTVRDMTFFRTGGHTETAWGGGGRGGHRCAVALGGRRQTGSVYDPTRLGLKLAAQKKQMISVFVSDLTFDTARIV
jgi:hypothetical protein